MKKITSIFNDQVKYPMAGLFFALLILAVARLTTSPQPFNMMMVLATGLFAMLALQSVFMYMYARQLAVKTKQTNK